MFEKAEPLIIRQSFCLADMIGNQLFSAWDVNETFLFVKKNFLLDYVSMPDKRDDRASFCVDFVLLTWYMLIG